MSRLKHIAASCAMALTVAFGANVAWSSHSLAATVDYEFTITSIGPEPIAGSFFIPVSDFSTAVANQTDFSLPVSDITALSMTEDSESFGLSDIVSGALLHFGMNASDIPQVYYVGGSLLVALPVGCSSSCQWGFGPGNYGLLWYVTPLGSTEEGGSWVTTVTPLPSTWTLMLLGLGASGLFGYFVSKRRTVPAVA
jgi:hypothetical protein